MARSDAWQTEPVLHTFISDCLPDDDPRAWMSIRCVDCRDVVHSIPNECMSPWADTEAGPMCWGCLTKELDLAFTEPPRIDGIYLVPALTLAPDLDSP